MTKSKDIKKGTIIEVIKEEEMMFFGDVMTSLVTQQNHLKIGEQYECLSDVKKLNGSLSVKLKQINGVKGGDIFFGFISSFIKIISTPTIEPIDPNLLSKDNEFKLNENEEFVLVKKDNPSLFFKSVETSFRNPDKNDVQTDYAVFNTKIGQRKKLKNSATLLGFLNNNSGTLDIDYHHPYSKNNPLLKAEQEYHLQGLDEVPYWILGAHMKDFEDFKYLELRKYNTDTRTVTSVAVDFDCVAYIRKFTQTMNLTRIFGEGVSAVIKKLIDNDSLGEFKYIVSAKFNHKKYTYNYMIPREKDINLDLALKMLKLKKKDVPHHNNHGFIAVAFKTEEEKNNFLTTYKNNEKIISEYLIDDIIHHPEINLEHLTGEKKKSPQP